jgi:hypothetical protein
MDIQQLSPVTLLTEPSIEQAVAGATRHANLRSQLERAMICASRGVVPDPPQILRKQLNRGRLMPCGGRPMLWKE